jgi:hypothetical protein
MKKNTLGLLTILTLAFIFSAPVCAGIWLGNGSLAEPNIPADPNNNHWNVNNNWSAGVPPISGEDVYIDRNTRLQPLVDASITAVGGVVRMGGTSGGGTTNKLTVTGGSTTFTGHFIMGEGAGSKATLEVSGGSFQSNTLWVGNSGKATVLITGGKITTKAESLYVDRFNKVSCVIYLYGGVIEQTGSIYMGSGGLIDITEGTLIFSGDRRGTVNGYITAGKIKAYSGASTVVVDYNTTNPGKTTVTAVILKKAWKPSPTVGAVVEDLQTDLSWMSGSGAVSHTVYFGTSQTAVASGDPSVLKGTQVGTTYDPGLLTSGQTYYWRIDENDGFAVYPGDVWSFAAIDPKQASKPNPANGATGVSFKGAVLSWTAGVGAISHDVYFGESAGALTAVSLGQTNPNYALGTLIKAKQYFWRVDENNGSLTTQGIVWSFTVVTGASSTTWTNADPNSELWSSELNWNNGTPGLLSDIYIDSEPNVLIDDTVTAAVGKTSRISITHPTDPNLPMIFMTGGNVTLTGDFVFGQNNGSKPVMKISGGTANIYSLWTGNMDNWNMGSGRIQITGGTVNCEYLFISRSSPTTGQKGAIQLDGGVINTNGFNMGHGYMDITDGVLIINGNAVAQVKGYIYGDWITAFGGTKAVSVVYNQTTDKTTVMACQKVLQTDFNGDCIVDLLDYAVIASAWLSDYTITDLNHLTAEWLQ